MRMTILQVKKVSKVQKTKQRFEALSYCFVFSVGGRVCSTLRLHGTHFQTLVIGCHVIVQGADH